VGCCHKYCNSDYFFCPSNWLNVQVGACIVNKDKKIVGIGYNGMPNGCDDNELPWQRTSDNWLETKYPYGKL
jgi:deoxycytidylate deaminase